MATAPELGARQPRPRLLSFPLDAPLDDVIYECRELLEDSDFPTVKTWQASGGKVLGHFQVYFPEELADAADLLPVKFRGAPIEKESADARFGSYICSILRPSLELALSGRLQPDLFVTHPICDAARNLAGIWGRNVESTAQILYLPQNPNSAFAAQYLEEEYRRMLGDIEAVAGRTVTDEDLRVSIHTFNENRRLLRELYRIKRETPWLLPVHEAYVLVAVGSMIFREEHNELLRAVIPQIEAREAKKQDNIRVVFEGGFCEQPPLDLLHAIAQFCYVVDDDLLIGLRYILEDVSTEKPPLQALAHGYLEQSSYSPVQHDLRKPKEKMLLERIRPARPAQAQGEDAPGAHPSLGGRGMHRLRSQDVRAGPGRAGGLRGDARGRGHPLLRDGVRGADDLLRPPADPARDVRRKPHLRLRRRTL
jgi:benzoyl-CoA reductase subunit C